MNERSGADSPQETVLHAVSRMTGETPKILLRDSDSEEGRSPYIDPQARDTKLSLQGRANYQILGEVARGGMGVILKGHDTDLGRDVAVKVLDKKLVGNPAVLQRFVEEAQIGGQLQHPGVVPVYELGLMADERPFFTMKFVKGRTLSALLSKRKGLDDERRRFLSIFEQVCQTIAYAHSKGVIHRDLKPANVMVGAFGEVQVVDWGLAKVLSSGGVADELMAKRSQFTVIETVRSGPGSGGSDSVVGSVMGTPAYMAPEQALGEIEKVDERADVFSLGAILCEIITGAPPYESDEKERTIRLAAHAKLDPARERIEACPADPELKALCLECLSPAPAARPQNAEEVAQRIHGYLASLEEKAHRAELAAAEAREQRKRQRLTLALAATVVGALLVIGFVMRRVEKQREASRLQQLATTQKALDDASAQVIGLQENQRYDEALEVARAALLVVESGDVQAPALSERANHMVEMAEQRVAEQAQRLDVERSNRELLARCEELRMKQIEAAFGFSPRDLNQTLEQAYVEAFRTYGIDLTSEDLPAALEKLRASGIGVEAALALDDWASIRRLIYGWDAYEVEAVLALAFDLDPDPQRTRMREALLANDRDQLLELARTARLAEMPPSTLWALSQGLYSMKLDDEAAEVIRAGVGAHPTDFLLNFKMGHIYANAGQDIPSIRYLAAARALRPENAAVHALLGDAYNHIGDDPRAEDAYLAALRLNPDLARIHRFIGWYAFLSGDLETAVPAYEKALELFPSDTQWEFESKLARSFAGELPMARIASERRPGELSMEAGFTAWGLVFHPDPAQRDPERALEVIAPFLPSRYWGMGGFRIAAAANLRLGRPAEALALLEEGDRMRSDTALNLECADELVFAWTHHDLGDPEQAREHFRLAGNLFEDFLYDGWEPWRGSVVERLYHEVEAMVE